MSKKLYVGNLSYIVGNRELETMFAAHGTVTSANVVIDRDSGRSRGFGFVEMRDDHEARAAISALHGKDFDGRGLIVNEARAREERGGDRQGGFGGGRRS